MADLYSNPLPPPPRPGSPPAVEQTPKSNADFRALLATPRAERGNYKSSFGGSGGGGGGSGGEPAEKKEKKAKKPPKPKPAEDEAEKEDDGSAYRCRSWTPFCPMP